MMRGAYSKFKLEDMSIHTINYQLLYHHNGMAHIHVLDEWNAEQEQERTVILNTGTRSHNTLLYQNKNDDNKDKTKTTT